MAEDTARPLPGRTLRTVRGWHDSAFWRGVWLNVVSAMIVAFLIYTVALLAGYGSRNIGVAVSLCALAISGLTLLVLMALAVRLSSDFWRLFVTWPEAVTDRQRLAQSIYNPFVFSLLAVVASVSFLVIFMTN